MLREKLASRPKGGSQHPFAISQWKVHIALDTSQFFFSFFPNEPRSPPSRTTEQTKIGKKLKRDIEESKQDVQESIKERERKRSDSV